MEAGEFFLGKLSPVALGVHDGQMVQEQFPGRFAAIVDERLRGEGNPAAIAEHVKGADLLTGFCVPKSDGAVPRARQDLPAMRTEADGGDPAGMSLEA